MLLLMGKPLSISASFSLRSQRPCRTCEVCLYNSKKLAVRCVTDEATRFEISLAVQSGSDHTSYEDFQHELHTRPAIPETPQPAW